MLKDGKRNTINFPTPVFFRTFAADLLSTTILIRIMKTIKKIFLMALATIATLPTMGQDLLASQAPVDRTMKAVDSMMLQRLILVEEETSPAASLYADWNRESTFQMGILPDSLHIDLRGFCMPTDSRRITSNFGARWGRKHKGIDVKVYIGDTIRAAFSGKVRIVRYEGRGYGKYVVIRHSNGLETLYGHLSKQLVKENEEVKAGDPIGLGGNTGRSTGSHLHFETRLCGVSLNPALMFDFQNQDVVGDQYFFRKNTYTKESAEATRLRGVAGKSVGVDRLEDNGTKGSRQQASGSTRYHKVVRGETLTSIARKHRTTVSALCKLNHISQNVRLMPGQILKYN